MAWEPAPRPSNGRPLTLALPKGRLLRPALDLLRRAGFRGLPEDDVAGSCSPIRPARCASLILKPLDVPTYVEHGAADARDRGQGRPARAGAGRLRAARPRVRLLPAGGRRAARALGARRPRQVVLGARRDQVSEPHAAVLRRAGHPGRGGPARRLDRAGAPRRDWPSASWTSCSRARRSAPTAWSRLPRSLRPPRG